MKKRNSPPPSSSDGGIGSETLLHASQRTMAVNEFKFINERPVDDISLNFFYKPHTITLLAVSIFGVMYFAFVRNQSDIQENIWAGMLCVIFFFLIISVLAFPNGPFTRPHPVVWRMLFGLSVLYLMLLQFLMFQDYKSIMGIFYWFDPKLRHFHIDMEKQYAANCSDMSLDRIWSHVDVFAWGHFLGWAFKAVLIRHMGILWAISVMWEITEITFAHLLPNFAECWWDALILDVLLCNGFGIWCGLKICKLLEMREYKWASIRDISSTTGKLKRAVLQFTPESWAPVRWLDPKCTYMRFFAVCQLVLLWQLTELNTFFLKHIFEMPPSHPVVIGRLVFVGLFTAPSVRQYYIYVTDTRCKRLGTQCWVYIAILVSEAILCIKNGKELFERTQVKNIVVWLIIQAVLSVLFVYGCMLWHRYVAEDDSRDGSPVKQANRLFKDSAIVSGDSKGNEGGFSSSGKKSHQSTPTKRARSQQGHTEVTLTVSQGSSTVKSVREHLE